MAIPEATLGAAATNIYDDLWSKYLATTINANVVTFWSALTATFPASGANNQPCANWLAVIAGYNDTYTGNTTLPVISQLLAYIYRFLLLTAALQSQNLITAAQANAVLSSFNTAFA